MTKPRARGTGHFPASSVGLGSCGWRQAFPFSPSAGLHFSPLTFPTPGEEGIEEKYTYTLRSLLPPHTVLQIIKQESP